MWCGSLIPRGQQGSQKLKAQVTPKTISDFYRMFTKSTQNENKGEFHGKSTPKDPERQNILSLSNEFWGNYLQDKGLES